MPKYQACTCPAKRHTSKKAVSNCPNKPPVNSKKHDSAAIKVSSNFPQDEIRLTIIEPEVITTRSRVIKKVELKDPTITHGNLSRYLDKDDDIIPVRNGWETIQRRFINGHMDSAALGRRASLLSYCSRIFAQELANKLGFLSVEERSRLYYKFLDLTHDYAQTYSQDPFFGLRAPVAERFEGFREFLEKFTSQQDINQRVRQYKLERNEGRFSVVERVLREAIKRQWFRNIRVNKKRLNDFDLIYQHFSRFQPEWTNLFYRQHPEFESVYYTQIGIMTEMLADNIRAIKSSQKRRKQWKASIAEEQLEDNVERSFQPIKKQEEEPSLIKWEPSVYNVPHTFSKTLQIIKKEEQSQLLQASPKIKKIKKIKVKKVPSLQERLERYQMTGQMTFFEDELDEIDQK